ncbi:YkgJ family cysteine cluster protein [Sporomusa silvacetica]|uniref:YkgJ family cysteine cluster protein n=1 Tax=Sporomusa silvacetica TaxID=55504 RepID=UPI000B99EB5D
MDRCFCKSRRRKLVAQGIFKSPRTDAVDKIVNRLHRELFAGFNCVACSNCCKTIIPVIEKEIRVISSKLGLNPEDYKKKFLVSTEEGFMINKNPCPHLGINGCSIYEYRPENCREYPFTEKKKIRGRLINLVANCSVQPTGRSVRNRER